MDVINEFEFKWDNDCNVLQTLGIENDNVKMKLKWSLWRKWENGIKCWNGVYGMDHVEEMTLRCDRMMWKWRGDDVWNIL